MATHSRILPRRIPWTGGPGVYSPRDFEESNMAEGLSHPRGGVVFLGLPERGNFYSPMPWRPRDEAAPRGDCCVVRTKRRWVSSENCLPGALRGWRQLLLTHQRGSQRNTYPDPSLLLLSDHLPKHTSDQTKPEERTKSTHRSALKAEWAGARLDLEGYMDLLQLPHGYTLPWAMVSELGQPYSSQPWRKDQYTSCGNWIHVKF